ncbi:MAG: HlyD family efflux transporter periplasmic adaptor subunit [Bacteroidales bacterium]|nr:HlyD family efflux transporter periplasmic adaptor subunit [Bacteroidales bacterium]
MKNLILNLPIKAFCTTAALATLFLTGCKQKQTEFDAGGTLEAVTLTVSAYGNGNILWLHGQEGTQVQKGQLLGYTDTMPFYLQKKALAATRTHTPGPALDAQMDQVQYMIDNCRIISPISGTIINRYAQGGELAYAGKPLFRIADLDTMQLKAYVTAKRLSDLKLNQEVQVFSLQGEKEVFYRGRLIYIADHAEFTPKSVQTQSERENLVYAVKIAVKNDGFLKIGMHAEVIF